MKKMILVLSAVVFFALNVNADEHHKKMNDQMKKDNMVNDATVEATFSNFQEILKRHYKERTLPGGGFETAFKYKEAYKNQDTQADLKKQLEVLKNFKISNLKNKEQATAFWVNTYNFLMIAKIFKDGFKKGKLDIDGVKDLGSLFNPYKAFGEKDFFVDGAKVSLRQVEKEILLGEEYKKKGWKDARIHFAVNCASVGCPPVHKKVYSENNVSGNMDDNIKKALKTKRHFHFGTGSDKNKLYVTSLFKWYKKDFVEHSGSVQHFLAEFEMDESKKLKILSVKDSDIEHIDYDWSLNNPKNFGF